MDLILVVDDEADLRTAIGDYLEFEGLNYIEAGSARDALKIVSENQNVKFVLSDIKMPNGDGIFLLEELRKRSPDTPIVALITGESATSRDAAIKMGALDLFYKPLDMDTVVSVIKSTLQK